MMGKKKMLVWSWRSEKNNADIRMNTDNTDIIKSELSV
jgi:hypothetical protein